MLAESKKIFEKAVTLPPFERIEIIENLFFSLDSEKARKRIDKLWANEAEDRLDAFENGKIKTISSTEVFSKINSLQK